MHKIIMASLAIFLINVLPAQEQKKDTKTPTASYFKAGIDYLSNSVYNGRKDSLTTAYYSPTIGYFDKSGFFISGTVSWLSTSTESRIDLFGIDLGYDFSISDKVTGGVYGNKSFYNQSSTTVNSGVKGSLGAYLTYDPGVISLTGGIDATFSKATDIGTNAAISHEFYMGEVGDQWSISPTIGMNAGTQNYYQDYFQDRKKSLKPLRILSSNNIKVIGSDKFTLLDYELSLPVSFDGKNWGLSFKPYYAIPVNPVSVSLNNGATYKTEQLENSFYAEVGVYIKF